MRSVNRITWFLEHPWAIILIVLILLAIGAFIVWQNIQETKAKDAQRRRDRGQGDSIWDD